MKVRRHRFTTAGPSATAGQLLLLGGIWLAALLAGCASMVTDKRIDVHVDVVDALQRYERAYVLQPGDQIEIVVYRHPELSRKAIVRPDGVVTLPIANDVVATGATPAELRARIAKALAARLLDPEVTVIVDNPPEPMVYVVGEVGAPKAIPLRLARTVAQALAQAGGVAKSGDATHVSIIRLNKDGYLESHAVVMSGYNQAETFMALSNMALMPYDLVLVPESDRSQIMRVIQDINTTLTPYFQIRILQLAS